MREETPEDRAALRDAIWSVQHQAFRIMRADDPKVVTRAKRELAKKVDALVRVALELRASRVEALS